MTGLRGPNRLSARDGRRWMRGGTQRGNTAKNDEEMMEHLLWLGAKHFSFFFSDWSYSVRTGFTVKLCVIDIRRAVLFPALMLHLRNHRCCLGFCLKVKVNALKTCKSVLKLWLGLETTECCFKWSY